MSVINRMLQDLDKRRAAGADVPAAVRSLPPDANRAAAARWLILLLLVVAVAGAGLYVFRISSYPSPVPAAAQPQAVARAESPQVAAAPASAPPAAPEPAPAPAPAKPELPKQEPSKQEPPTAQAAARTAPAKEPGVAPRAASTVSAPRTEPPTDAESDEAASPSPSSAPAPRIEKRMLTPQPAARTPTSEERAMALLHEGRRAEAQALLAQSLARDPRQPALAMLASRLMAEQGDLGGAAQTLQQALPAAAGDAAFRALLAAVLQRAGRHAEAAEHYGAALKLAPQNGVWWMGLGISLEAQGHPLEAREAFQRARHAGNLPPEVAAYVDQKLATPLPQ